jgi:hypothetical protein
MVYFECNPDEVLLRKLGCARKNRSHLSGKSRVCKRLEETKSAVGLVDEDPLSIQPPYVTNLKLVEEDYDIKVYEDVRRNHRVIALRPRLEEWIIATAEAAKTSLQDFGLSERANDLHREINTKIPNFEKLLDKLLAEDNRRLTYLKGVLGL